VAGRLEGDALGGAPGRSLMAAVLMAFIGWIGTGVLKARPTMILKRPKLTRTPTESILVSVI
jgi:hypothetical protein